MESKRIYVLGVIIGVIFFMLGFSETEEQHDDFSETVKIALRDVGNKLLLVNQDSTSLVLPIIELEKDKYQLSFEKNISFDPSDLVSFIKESFKKAQLPNEYIVEVLRCADKEVPYSFLMQNNVESDIIPCGGRFLPNGCYIIEVNFTKATSSLSTSHIIMYSLLFVAILLIILVLYKRKQPKIDNGSNKNYTSLGSFQFYPEQHILIKKAVEINLSKKECELLEIFVAHPNQVVKRDDLIKKVWEDNGVFVGRSLDTYISKLRKKLQEDETIKLTNVHGIGYKLEITV